MLRHMYYSHDKNIIHTSMLGADGRTFLKFPKRPFRLDFEVTFIHPMKTGVDMAFFHNQVYHSLRPLLDFPARADENQHISLAVIRNLQRSFRYSCVASGTLQAKINTERLPECSPPTLDALELAQAKLLPFVAERLYIMGLRAEGETLGATIQKLGIGLCWLLCDYNVGCYVILCFSHDYTNAAPISLALLFFSISLLSFSFFFTWEHICFLSSSG